MQESNQIQELALAFAKYIPILAGTAGMKNTRFFTAEVKSVNINDRTCSVEGVMDNEAMVYNDVNLSMEANDGVIEFPAVDSTVMVCKMPDGETYVVRTSDIDRWLCYIDSNNKLEASINGFIFNGGTFGGLVKSTPLTGALNDIESRVNLIAVDLAAIATAAGATGTTPVTGTSLAAFINAAIANIVTPLTPTVITNIENLKIQH